MGSQGEGYKAIYSEYNVNVAVRDLRAEIRVRINASFPLFLIPPTHPTAVAAAVQEQS